MNVSILSGEAAGRRDLRFRHRVLTQQKNTFKVGRSDVILQSFRKEPIMKKKCLDTAQKAAKFVAVAAFGVGVMPAVLLAMALYWHPGDVLEY